MESGKGNAIGLLTLRAGEVNTLFIGVEVIGIGLATGWALAALFGFNKVLEAILMGIFALGAGAFTWSFVRNAAKIEPIVER